MRLVAIGCTRPEDRLGGVRFVRIQGAFVAGAARASQWFSRLLIRLRGSDGALLGSMPLRVLLCCCDVFIMRPLTVKVNNNLSTLTVCEQEKNSACLLL